MTELLAIFRDHGLGTRLLRAFENYTRDYVFSPDEGRDHEPTEFERMLFEDMINGAFSDPAIGAILQEAARGMKAGGMDPEADRICEVCGALRCHHHAEFDGYVCDSCEANWTDQGRS